MARQRELGLNPQPDIYTCDCGFSSNRKDKLSLHKKKCEDSSPSLTINNTGTTNNIINNNNSNNTTNNSTQNNYIINLDGKMAELFFQRVKDSLSADYLRELCERGYADLSDHVIVNSIKNETGGSDIRVADSARQKLMVKTITGDIEEDMGAHKTKARIGAAVDEVLSWSHKKDKKSEKIIETMRIADNDRKDGRPDLRKRILIKCPRTFDTQISSEEWASNYVSPNESILEKIDRKEAKAKEKRGHIWRKYLRDNKMVDPNGGFWDNRTGFVWTENNDKISLLGRSIKYQGALSKFNRKDLAEIDQMGLSENVAPGSQDYRSINLLEPGDQKSEPPLSNSQRWLNKFIRHAYPLENTDFFANRPMKVVVKLGLGGNFTIVGGRCEITGNLIGLSDSQIDELEEADVDDHIDFNSKPKIYSSDPKEKVVDTTAYTSQVQFM